MNTTPGKNNRNHGIISCASPNLVVALAAVTILLSFIITDHAQAARKPQSSWQFTQNSMSTPRREHGITMLEDGRILVVGGLNPSPSPSSDTFTPSSNTWMPTGDLNTPRFWFGNVVPLRTGEVLIAGGTDATGYNDFNTSEVYSPTAGTWRNTQDTLNTARRNATLTVLPDGRVLIAGGRHGLPDGSSFLASSEIYDPLADTWTNTTGNMMNVAREGHLAVLLKNGKVLIAGGEGPWRVAGKTAELFDPTTQMWSLTGSMSDGWLAGSATLTLLADGRVLRTGGTDGQGNYYSTAEIYDQGSGTWTPVHSMTTARANHSATLLPNGRVLIAGGENLAGTLVTSEVYDPILDTWTLDVNLQDALGRAGHRAIMLPSGRVLIAGGWTGSTSNLLSSAEVYNNTSYGPPSSVKFAEPYGKKNQTWTDEISCVYADLNCFLTGDYHVGIDSSELTKGNGAVISTTVTAIAPGKIVMKQPNDGTDNNYGRTVILEHTLVNGTKTYSLYAHLRSFDSELPDVGACIDQGKRIGIVGDSGGGIERYWTIAANGQYNVHLHMEFKVYPVRGDPRTAIANPGSQGTFFGYTIPGDDAHYPDRWGYRDPDVFIGRLLALIGCP